MNANTNTKGNISDWVIDRLDYEVMRRSEYNFRNDVIATQPEGFATEAEAKKALKERILNQLIHLQKESTYLQKQLAQLG